MLILVNHLTRMTAPNICVAGIEVVKKGDKYVSTGRHIRPVCRPNLNVSHLRLFQLGRLVDLGAVVEAGSTPEIEDVRFRVRSTAVASSIRPEAFLETMSKVAKPTLSEIFGDELEQRGKTGCLPEGRGLCSLGVLTARRTQLSIEPSDKGDKLFALFSDNFGPRRLRVTDARFCRPPDWQLDADVVQSVNQALSSVEAHIAVGVGRPFAGNPESEKVHWLQANNIFPTSTPLWEGTLANLWQR